MSSNSVGRYIVIDPDICHGQPVFRGTRIMVSDVLEQVANGMAWEVIIEEWHGTLTKEAIAESLRMAREIRRFIKHSKFNTQAKRMGNVVQIGHTGIRIWRLNEEQEEKIDWNL